MGSSLWLCFFCALSGATAHYALQPLQDAPPPDTETSVLLPRLADKYRPAAGNWDDVIDPKLYLLTEPENEFLSAKRLQKRTSGPSLSIVNPLDVLRQRLLLEIARRRMRQSEDQIIANREWLKTIGKRSVSK
ncbi:corticotropin-releasing diuretic hormone 44 isoform X2 [Lycorma delicatula]